jgi:hypothetical protein
MGIFKMIQFVEAHDLTQLYLVIFLKQKIEAVHENSILVDNAVQ